MILEIPDPVEPRITRLSHDTSRTYDSFLTHDILHLFFRMTRQRWIVVLDVRSDWRAWHRQLCRISRQDSIRQRHQQRRKLRKLTELRGIKMAPMMYETDDVWDWWCMRLMMYETDDVWDWWCMRLMMYETDDVWDWWCMRLMMYETDDVWDWWCMRLMMYETDDV